MEVEISLVCAILLRVLLPPPATPLIPHAAASVELLPILPAAMGVDPTSVEVSACAPPVKVVEVATGDLEGGTPFTGRNTAAAVEVAAAAAAKTAPNSCPLRPKG